MGDKYISIVIPNYNKALTIGKCLEAVLSLKYKNFEVVVVDDHSEDNSIEVIKKHLCKLICLEEHSGASKARNTGALNSSGEIIFFIDADCLLLENTLLIVNDILSKTGPETIIGGTYTQMPYDKNFFSIFQSVFINYSEIKNANNPDYIPAHAMVIDARTFKKNNGFHENFLPILEDVEFSHRLQKAGYKLIINPEIQVQHIFNFSLFKSLKNAIKKSRYWVMYSIINKDLFADSGTASRELKINVASYFLILVFLLLWIISTKSIFLYTPPLIFLINIFINRGLLKAFYKASGMLFAILSSMYYLIIYPVPVAIGTIMGIFDTVCKKGKPK